MVIGQGPRAGLDTVEKIQTLPPPGIEPVQSVDHRYTDWATAIHCLFI
jgi:hypothetical protein